MKYIPLGALWLLLLVLSVTGHYQLQAQTIEQTEHSATNGDSLPSQQTQHTIAAIRAALPSSIQAKEIIALEGTPFFRVELVDGSLIFTTADARNFIVGDIFVHQNGQFVNLSETLRNQERLALLSKVALEDMVVFPPESNTKKRFIYVFTDIDCGYCRRLHEEIEMYQSLGIEVRYLAWPRCGTESSCPSYQKAVNVWCAKDKLHAMTQAKSGQPVPYATCANPVREQFALGRKLGIQGTPFIMLDNGIGVPGYQPAGKIADLL